MKGISLRPTIAEDEALLLNLIEAAATNLPGGGAPFQFAPISASEVRDAGGEIWTFVGNEAVCGCVGLLPDQRGGAEVTPIILSPGWQGIGLGRWLIDEAKRFAAKAGFSPLWVRVPSIFAKSVVRLEACGFRQSEVPSWLPMPADDTYLQFGQRD